LKLPDGRETTVGEVVVDLMGKNSIESLPFLGEKRISAAVEAEVIRSAPRNVTYDTEASQ
jgi:hypothetical protein